MEEIVVDAEAWSEKDEAEFQEFEKQIKKRSVGIIKLLVEWLKSEPEIRRCETIMVLGFTHRLDGSVPIFMGVGLDDEGENIIDLFKVWDILTEKVEYTNKCRQALKAHLEVKNGN